MYRILLVSFLVFSFPSFSQKRISGNQEQIPNTILWKVTGKDCSKPSYLLGTLHLADSQWLLNFPEILSVIDSTRFILTEAFSTKPYSVFKLSGAKLKAIPLLTPQQFKTLDSFFVARVGEGIVNNTEAQEMSVSEMEGAILYTLVANSQSPDGITKLMDKDLFELYKSKGLQGDRLDRVAQTDFDSTSIDKARSYLTRSLKYIDGSDKPGWNVYGGMKMDSIMRVYKAMQVNYKLNEEDSDAGEPVNEVNYVTLKQRNQNWIPKIEENISKQPCLIAVGHQHLWYKTGIISLLRASGYTVTPVSIASVKK